jgi:hypothetical protein
MSLVHPLRSFETTEECFMESGLRVSDAVLRLKGVFLEVPGTQLSLSQASQLSGLECSICQTILSALEDARFLKRGRNGLYQRRTDDSPN